MATSNHAANAIKVTKLILNIIIVVLYKYGDGGYFLGSSFNKNHDAESLAAGVYVGYLIYNLVVLISTCFDANSVSQSLTETLMNAVGFVVWMVTAAVVIQFWLRFIPANHTIKTQNPAAVGIAMGTLTIVNSALYCGETVLTYMNYKRRESEKY